jgi:hypothetical protein
MLRWMALLRFLRALTTRGREEEEEDFKLES